MVQMGEKSDNEDSKKPKYASLLKGQTIQTIRRGFKFVCLPSGTSGKIKR